MNFSKNTQLLEKVNFIARFKACQDNRQLQENSKFPLLTIMHSTYEEIMRTCCKIHTHTHTHIYIERERERITTDST